MVFNRGARNRGLHGHQHARLHELLVLDIEAPFEPHHIRGLHFENLLAGFHEVALLVGQIADHAIRVAGDPVLFHHHDGFLVVGGSLGDGRAGIREVLLEAGERDLILKYVALRTAAFLRGFLRGRQFLDAEPHAFLCRRFNRLGRNAGFLRGLHLGCHDLIVQKRKNLSRPHDCTFLDAPELFGRLARMVDAEGIGRVDVVVAHREQFDLAIHLSGHLLALVELNGAAAHDEWLASDHDTSGEFHRELGRVEQLADIDVRIVRSGWSLDLDGCGVGIPATDGGECDEGGRGESGRQDERLDAHWSSLTGTRNGVVTG